MPTRRQNLIDLLEGRTPQWTPCSINIGQWYTHQRAHGTLPEALRDTETHLDAMKVLGCDVFSRNSPSGFFGRPEGFEPVTTTQPGEQGPRRIEQIETPHGTLRRVVEEQTEISTSYVVEDLVKDWKRDGEAYLWQLERTRYGWDRDVFDQTQSQVGDDGVVLAGVGCTPLKRLHADFGLDFSCLFVMDEPDAAKTVCDTYWQSLWPVLEEMAGDDRIHAACMMDNVDAPFYPPDFCEDYWTPYVRQAADLFDQHGKRLMVHACGQLHQLKQTFRDAHVHGLEGMAHPPIGNFTPADARDMPDGFIFNGGFTPQEQVILRDDELHGFYEDFFRELAGYPQFIFAAACQTEINTPWSRIQRIVELCREYGGRPQ